MNWGSELWDRYDSVLTHVNKGTEELSTFYSKFIKERGEVEKEYAKNLRKIIAKYCAKDKKELSEDTSQIKGFRLVLQELGYQAGQHEILAEMLCKSIPQDVQNKVKDIAKVTKNNLKDAKKISEDLEKSYRYLDKSKSKYQRSFIDWEQADSNHKKSESDGTVSRNEISKLKSQSDSRQRQCDEQKQVYASQLLKTNRHQAEYYSKQLPAVLNNLQDIEVDRVNYLKMVMNNAIETEREVTPIISKCQEESKTVVSRIDPSADTNSLTNRLKTGNLPPVDFPFEEMTPGCMDNVPRYGTLSRKKSKLNINQKESPVGNTPNEAMNLFPRKRDIKKRIEVTEFDIEKGNKEIKALQLMVTSYKQNPKFGDATKFQEELDIAIHKVQVLESDLHSLNRELEDVDIQLENRKKPSGKPSPQCTPLTIRKIDSPGGSRSSSIQSVGYFSNSDKDSSTVSSNSEQGEVEVDDGRLSQDFIGESLDRVVALYSYNGEVESSIAMQTGEEFLVTESDCDGWIRVRRLSDFAEGYVPTSYLQWL